MFDKDEMAFAAKDKTFHTVRLQLFQSRQFVLDSMTFQRYAPVSYQTKLITDKPLKQIRLVKMEGFDNCYNRIEFSPFDLLVRDILIFLTTPEVTYNKVPSPPLDQTQVLALRDFIPRAATIKFSMVERNTVVIRR